MVGDGVGEGAEVVFDCVGSASSIDDALAIVRPREQVVLVGMPGRVAVDLTGLWHKEIRLVGAYAYGQESTGERTFDLAFDLVAGAGLGRLVSATYSLDRYRDAIDHAANAGARGAVKVVFDLRGERNR
jgi:threonine dehydrogenase-like Zn-dependent dehydrogenase